MGEYFHSVRLIADRCKGCVNCIKRCPTEAIRIRGGQAHITEARCVDCGECIRRCANHAKTAVTDSLLDLEAYNYNVALPAPSLYGQFNLDVSIDAILAGLLKIGFDEVYEVAQGADLVTAAISRYLMRNGKRPAISSACPAVVRLVQVKYPELIDNLIPAAAPVEVAACEARRVVSSRLALSPDKIGIWFLTPCPAKMTAVRQPLGQEQSNLTGAIAISHIFFPLLKAIAALPPGEKPRQKSSWVGISWAVAGGEAAAVGKQNTLVVHEIHNVSDMLEQVAMGKLADVDYIEGLACAGGCIGGPLTVENRFVAQHWLQQRIRSEKMKPRIVYPEQETPYKEIVGGQPLVEPRPVMRLDEDIHKAMYKVEVMENILQKLPGLDCGSCGSPNCKALAEDIAQGTASETDCVFKLRARVRDLAQEMVDLAGKLPPSLDKNGGE